MNYILDGHEVIEEPDIRKWANWYETANRHVNQTTATVSLGGENVGEIRISTIFLGIDHSFEEGPPLLFETMVFGGKLDLEMDRCSTWGAAEKMHDLMLEKVKLAVK